MLLETKGQALKHTFAIAESVYDQLLKTERIQSRPYIPLAYSHVCFK